MASLSRYIEPIKKGYKSWEEVVLFKAANVNAAMGLERMYIRLVNPQPNTTFRSIQME